MIRRLTVYLDSCECYSLIVEACVRGWGGTKIKIVILKMFISFILYNCITVHGGKKH